MPAATESLDFTRVLPALRDYLEILKQHDDRTDRHLSQLRIIARQRERAAKSLSRELERTRTKAETPASRRDEAARARALEAEYPDGVAVAVEPIHGGTFAIQPGEYLVVLGIAAADMIKVQHRSGRRIDVPRTSIKPASPRKSASSIIRKSYDPPTAKFGFYLVDADGVGSVRAAGNRHEAELLRTKTLSENPGSIASSIEPLDSSWACVCNGVGHCRCHKH